MQFNHYQRVNATQTVTQQLAIPTAVKADGRTATASANGHQAVRYRNSNQQTVADYRLVKSNSSTQAQQVFAEQGLPKRTSGQQVTLKDGTKAIVQGAMGRVYIQWQERNWTITAITNPTAATTPAKAAQQAQRVQSSIQQTKLTAQTVDHGAALYDLDANTQSANQISWQRGSQVGTTSGNTPQVANQIASSSVNDD